MGRKLVQETNLQNIAAAIRAKNGSSSTYKPREMADAIRSLPSSSTLVPKAITENGSYSPQSENADGYSSVTVNVGRYWGNKSITRNGTFRAASDHVDGYSSVSVNVPNSYSALDEGKVVSSGALTPQTSLSVTQNGTFDTTRNNQVTVNVSGASNTLVSKTIIANGTYLPADDNADGFNWVNVAVPGGFEASDEGKVVQNGALMPQSSLTVTANGTYDTTASSSVVVYVSGGTTTVLSGTSAPTAAQGSNGDLYMQYWQSAVHLPTGYTPIEYIEATGTQYINTGYCPKINTTVEADAVVFSTNVAYPALFGTATNRSISSVFSLYVRHASYGTTFVSHGNINGRQLNNMPFGDRLHVTLSPTEVSWTGENVSYTSSLSAMDTDALQPLFLLNQNNLGSSDGTNLCKGKLYRFRILEGETLVHDYVPALNFSNEVGLYDLVGQEFLGNAGSGNFINGPVPGTIITAMLKVNGVWMPLVGEMINHVNES